MGDDAEKKDQPADAENQAKPEDAAEKKDAEDAKADEKTNLVKMPALPKNPLDSEPYVPSD